MTDEFSVIENTFVSLISNRSGLIKQSIGDDAAILSQPANMDLVISTDTMVENVHFLPSWPADVVAYKLIASNISDMAAMAAEPKYISLALTLPNIDKQWLMDFNKGLAEALSKFNIDLIGGDLTQGSKTLSVTINGLVPEDRAVLRSGAKVGDNIYVTGTLGEGAYAVSQLPFAAQDDPILEKLFFPVPRTAYCFVLRQFASSAIDISDGLSADLGHILKASQVGACLRESHLPLSPKLKDKIPPEQFVEQVLNSGDEYELCFTVPKIKSSAMEVALEKLGLPFYRIGKVIENQGLYLLDSNDKQIKIESKGFQHFRNET